MNKGKKNPCLTCVLPGTGFDEEAALLGAGREFALMKTASGKVRWKNCECISLGWLVVSALFVVLWNICVSSVSVEVFHPG